MGFLLHKGMKFFRRVGGGELLGSYYIEWVVGIEGPFKEDSNAVYMRCRKKKK